MRMILQHGCNLAGKGRGLECTWVNNDNFTVPVSGGAVEWACVLCGHHIQNDRASRTTKLHHILCWAWTFLCRNYLDDSKGHRYGWATVEWQLHHYYMPTQALHFLQRFLAKHQITQVTQTRYCPDLAPCDFWFSQNQNHLWKGRDSRLSMRFKQIQWGS